jgi:glycosyltransferase involved in cell wall biosynthesis
VKLSVVMAVYDGAATLARTLDSIAAQTERDYELIVVDDGSADATPQILAAYSARDPRLRVVRQAHVGLTRALMFGCSAARAPVIARHDCGDVSMPERFATQLAAIDAGAVLASCFVRFTAPNGEHLYDVSGDGDVIRDSLLHGDVKTIRGLPHHGSAMFRRDAYVAAGGYRDAFRVAQDIDLWIRVAARGAITVVPEVLYEATYEPHAISARRRNDQIELMRIAIALRDGGPPSLLDDARRIGAKAAPPTKRDDAKALYFIAACLRRNGDPRYKDYARQAVRLDPLHLRARLLTLLR